MPARLILNADDFGLTPGINRAIAELHRAGVLTSATLMATGDAFDDAVALARTLPTLGVGCHIVLVDGKPASPPSEIPTLLGPDRRTFRRTLAAFVRDLLLHRIDPDDIAREARAQIEKLRAAGISMTHIDTHKHTHIFPRVLHALLQIDNLPALRNPFEPTFIRSPESVSLSGAQRNRRTYSSLTRRLQLAALHRFQPAFNRLTQGRLTTGGTLGIAATGTLTPATLRQILASLPAQGTYELCCHPGYYDVYLDSINTRLRGHREIERQALLTEIPRILSLPNAPELIHYGNLKQEPEDTF